jgi:hypothetical protein
MVSVYSVDFKATITYIDDVCLALSDNLVVPFPDLSGDRLSNGT